VIQLIGAGHIPNFFNFIWAVFYMSKNSQPQEAIEQYEKLEYYSDLRSKEISGMFEPYIGITDNYGKLVFRISNLLGGIKPKNIQDKVIRDLMADVFDCLYESRKLILSGKCTIAFLVGRRAYESLSLLHLSALDPSWAEKWEKGKKINNVEIRRELNKYPLGESKKLTDELYNFFCSATHPNRELIPHRFLGEGNQFVFGVIGRPDLIMVTDYCMKLLEFWFWLTATLTSFYNETIILRDKTFLEEYFKSKPEAEKIMKSLGENFNRLLEEFQNDNPEK